MRFVIDNSVTMRWLFGDGSEADRRYAETTLILLQEEGKCAVVPAIWPLEVGNVITRAEAKGFLSEARSTAFLALLREMSIEVDRHSDVLALGETLQLARRYGLSTYDASYLALALRDNIPLATNDAALRKALKKAGGIALSG
ncbi:MAG: type II toxin-antitoxin system VapC family toxin [Rhodocyclaceae bacterium]|nr:type II toxin-antitoxin system VapC family toxin [Rhodocyclaceae bacterium]MDZ4215096.1 type II toxin-antitoxin system VapC family toxin [Rhodocyclaceae bacterium]